MRPESVKTGRLVSWPVLIALFLAPLLVVVALLGLVRGGSESQITAAVVNLDEGTTIEDQFVPMGRQYAAEILGHEGENVTWILADEASADEGLTTGEYAAVVTIPENFSDAAMSFSANEADQARQARVDVDVSDNAPVGDAEVAQIIARIATESLNNMLTEQYLAGIYLGFNQVGDQFQQVVDGAAQIHDGAVQLDDGTHQATDGAHQLADGMDQLREGSDPLVTGGDQLVDGSRELGAGAGELADGAEQLNAGVQTMAGQMPALVDGVGQLADGAEQLLPSVSQFADGTVQALGGVGELKGGVDQIIAGMDSADQDFSELQLLVDGSSELAAGSDQVADGVQQLAEGLAPLDGLITDEMVAGVEQLSSQATGLGAAVREADQALQGYASGQLPVPAEVTALAEELKGRFVCVDQEPEVCALLQQAYEEGVDASIVGGFQTGAGAASQFLRSTDPETGRTYLELSDQFGGQVAESLGPVADGMRQVQGLSEGVQQLADGARQVADGNQQLAGGINQLATQLPAELESQLAQLRGGLVQISDGAGLLIQQTRPLVTGAPQLASGSAQLLDGIRQLNSQVGALPGGVQQLADGTRQLSDGAGQLSDGVSQFTDGTMRYVDGVWQYTHGVDQAGSGATDLADGMTELADGTSELEGGLDTFVDELSSGMEQVPTYSEADRETLSQTVASPVVTPNHLIDSGTAALTALVLASGLWLAALAGFVVARPVPSNVVTSNASSIRLWARTVGVPAGIVVGLGLVFGVAGAVTLSLPLGTSIGLVTLLAALGLVFVFTHHALAGWFGHIGRGASLVLLAVTVALGLSSAVPGWLSTVASVSPLHSGMLVVRSWLAGANIVAPVGVLLFIGALMAVASWAAIGMRRQLTSAQFALQRAAAGSKA